MKKRSWIFILFYLVFAISCSTLSFYHDYDNPCTNNQDPIECANWKNKYPREYRKYQERIEKHSEEFHKKLKERAEKEKVQ